MSTIANISLHYNLPLPIANIAPESDLRSPEKRFWDGFFLPFEAALQHDRLSIGELNALTLDERRGYETAIRAAKLVVADAAAFPNED